MIESDGKVSGAIIRVGTIPGVTQKDIVVPFEELKVSMRDGKSWLVISRTQEEIKLAPAYNDTGLPSEYRSPGGDIR
ncbi:hypothetical protein CU048_13755 [Beijerinckiaceae bacterium]|nr:hypothetical protein CU048_13755 [Beijerinckiaceae bacterium]